jgi:HEXXH motif-containing protein
MYANSGFNAYSTEEFKKLPVLQCLQESLEVLALIPSIYETVSNLVTCLHIIRPEDDEFDISYSLPTIPFSIFVSVPSKRMTNDVFRVAEAILHEAMHLQLTLIEKVEPLIIETDETYFSPWKNELRHPRGVLHAIYVFCVIRQFFELLIQNTILEKSTIEYLTRRCNCISEQLIEIKSFTNCPNLTKTGRLFISRSLENLIKHD